MTDEMVHGGENAAVVGGGGQHQPVIAERIRHRRILVAPCQIVNHHRLAQRLQTCRQLFHCPACVAVDGGVGDNDARFLRHVGRPGVIERQRLGCLLPQHRAVEGADDVDGHVGQLLQHGLYRAAVFAHDAEIVPGGLVRPVLCAVGFAEAAECVGGEKHLVGAVVGDHHLGPVDHGGSMEGQGVAAQ